MTDHPPAPVLIFVADILGAGLFGQIAHSLALLPGWAGGILGGLVVHIVGRLLGPTLDVHGQRLKARVTGRHAALPTRESDASDPSDDTDASG